MIETVLKIDCSAVYSYFRNMVGQFFKILPLKENEEESLNTYMRSLQLELIGFASLVPSLNDDQRVLSLIATLQYLIEHPECDTSVVKREVFRSISTCNKIHSEYNPRRVDRGEDRGCDDL